MAFPDDKDEWENIVEAGGANLEPGSRPSIKASRDSAVEPRKPLPAIIKNCSEDGDVLGASSRRDVYVDQPLFPDEDWGDGFGSPSSPVVEGSAEALEARRRSSGVDVGNLSRRPLTEGIAQTEENLTQSPKHDTKLSNIPMPSVLYSHPSSGDAPPPAFRTGQAVSEKEHGPNLEETAEKAGGDPGWTPEVIAEMPNSAERQQEQPHQQVLPLREMRRHSKKRVRKSIYAVGRDPEARKGLEERFKLGEFTPTRSEGQMPEVLLPSQILPVQPGEEELASVGSLFENERAEIRLGKLAGGRPEMVGEKLDKVTRLQEVGTELSVETVKDLAQQKPSSTHPPPPGLSEARRAEIDAKRQKIDSLKRAREARSSSPVDLITPTSTRAEIVPLLLLPARPKVHQPEIEATLRKFDSQWRARSERRPSNSDDFTEAWYKDASSRPSGEAPENLAQQRRSSIAAISSTQPLLPPVLPPVWARQAEIEVKRRTIDGPRRMGEARTSTGSDSFMESTLLNKQAEKPRHEEDTIAEQDEPDSGLAWPQIATELHKNIANETKETKGYPLKEGSGNKPADSSDEDKGLALPKTIQELLPKEGLGNKRADSSDDDSSLWGPTKDVQYTPRAATIYKPGDYEEAKQTNDSSSQVSQHQKAANAAPPLPTRIGELIDLELEAPDHLSSQLSESCCESAVFEESSKEPAEVAKVSQGAKTTMENQVKSSVLSRAWNLKMRMFGRVSDMMQPLPEPGNARIDWNCECGERLHAQVPIDAIPSAVKFAKEEAGAAHAHTISITQVVDGASGSDPSDSSGEASRGSSSRAGRTSGETSDGTQLTTPTIPSQSDVDVGGVAFPRNPPGTKQFLLVLADTGFAGTILRPAPPLTVMKNVDLTTIGQDEALMHQVRRALDEMRGPGWRRNPFLAPVAMRYINFKLLMLHGKGAFATCRTLDVLPPLKEVVAGRYKYWPCPADYGKFPIDPRIFIHMLQRPGGHTGQLAVQGLPKKLHTALGFDEEQVEDYFRVRDVLNNDDPIRLPEGWGIHLEIGVNWPLVQILSLAILLGSVAIVAAWSAIWADVQGGSGLGQYVVSVVAAGLSLLLVCNR